MLSRSLADSAPAAVQRTGVVLVAALVTLIASDAALTANKAGERQIKFYNIHNKERLDIVYKRRGRYVPAAMKKINWILRDWRRDEATRMDPKLIDILWEMHTELGSREPIHIISGYRSQKTNNMLRRTRGGQAKKSRHILGKAADVHFPDVPVKRMRYSAMVREKGGVGYYPTSAIPFVHVDTGRVRHWPRMPRTELALLFPDGRTKHRPRRGGPITRKDVRIAQARNSRLAREVASFHAFRRTPRAPRPTLVAENRFSPRGAPSSLAAWGDVKIARAPRERVTPPTRPAAGSGQQRTPAGAPTSGRTGAFAVAALDQRAPGLATGTRRGDGSSRPTAGNTRPSAPLQPTARASLGPRLSALPRPAKRPVDRPTRLQSPEAAKDRSRLTDLFTLASLFPSGGWFGLGGPPQADDPTDRKAGAGLASIDGPGTGTGSGSVAETARRGVTSALPDAAETASFVTAPEFDEEHPDELFYRPFPLGPLLTASSSPDDPLLSKMLAPDPVETLALLNDELTALPMKFVPNSDVAAVLWRDQFTTEAGAFGFVPEPATRSERTGAAALASRDVQTTPGGRL